MNIKSSQWKPNELEQQTRDKSFLIAQEAGGYVTFLQHAEPAVFLSSHDRQYKYVTVPLIQW